MKEKDKFLEQIDKMSDHFTQLEHRTADPGVRRYYSGIIAGLNKAYKLALNDMPFNLIRDE
jgi:hypothetical protein